MNIDTLSIARDLKAAALPPEQAEAIAAAIGRSVTEGVATKSDLELCEQRLAAKIDGGRGELRSEIETLRTEIEKSRNQLVLWVIGSQVTLAGLIIALIKL